MSEWIGWVGRLRRSIYARMEELSFRTGAATVAGVIAVAATAIVLTLTQGAHHAALRAAQAGDTSSRVLAAPPMSAYSPSAAHSSARTRPAAAPDVNYAPEPAKTPTATPQASPSASAPSPRRPLRGRGRHTTSATPGNPWGLPSPSQSFQFNGPG